MSGVALGIIIPTITGREDSFKRALAAYERTTVGFPGGVRLYVQRNAATCGEAWDKGADALASQVDYLHFGADDVEPHEGWWQPLKEAVDEGFCPSMIVLNPDRSIQSAGMRHGQPVMPGKDWAEVEHTLTPFISTAQWKLIRPIPHDLHFCTDWWVSARLAQHGIATIVRTGSFLTHHNHPAGRGAGMEEHARNRHDRALFAQHLNAYSEVAK